MNKIGGEFQIIPESLAFNDKFSKPLWSSGRSALRAILDHTFQRVGKGTVYIPDYICESVLNAVTSLDLSYKIYPLNDNLSIDLPWLDQQSFTNSDALIIVNYFGLLELSDSIKSIKEKFPQVTIIEDNVQAYWEQLKASDADYSFTSLRKTFPVPDGAVVRSKYEMSGPKNLPIAKFSEKKVVGGLLKEMGVEDSLYLSYFEQGEDLLDGSKLTEQASSYAADIMGNCDIKKIEMQRKRNARTVVDECEKVEIDLLLPYSEIKTPLFIPILIDNRDAIRKGLFKEGIFLPIHWPVKKEHCLTKGYSLSKKELSIVIDHRYTSSDMQRVIQTISKIQRGL